MLNQSIVLKSYISQGDYEKIKELSKLCTDSDKVNLKLELDYKLRRKKDADIASKDIDEYLYYIDDVLVGYLGISSFGDKTTAEINGLVHPEFRRKGISSKLLQLAMNECNNRKFKAILLLSDGKSDAGIEFIKAKGGKYDFSEYRMKLETKTSLETVKGVMLRKAEKADRKEIARQNSVYFSDEEVQDELTVEYEPAYIIELEGNSIGKIHVDYKDTSAFIFGFGVLPDYRSKGYGKAALKAALDLIDEKDIHDVQLDVACENSNALNLYKACGFKEKSVMDYYKIDAITNNKSM